MKRASSPENTECSDKKSKKTLENEGEGSEPTSQEPATTTNNGGGDADVTIVEKEVTEERVATPSTPLGESVKEAPHGESANEASGAIVSDGADKPDNQNEGEVMEVKDEETSETKPTDDSRWQLVPTTVRQRMNYLLTTSKLSDCVIKVGSSDTQQEFRLHSVILSMSSPQFEDMLCECENNIIIVPDVEPDIFKQILDYVYLDYVNLWSVEKTQALYRASVKFKLPHLCEKAVEYMMTKMSIDSIWPIFDAAIATADNILMEECNKFFKKNINDLLKHHNFSSVDQTVIASLVADDTLGVPESELVNGIIRWAHQKCIDNDKVPNLENKRSLLQPDTINNLRFLALSKDFFVNNVAYSKSKGDESILTMEESYAILMNMVLPNSYPLPEGFCTITKQRVVGSLERLLRRVFNPLGNYQPVIAGSPRLDKLTVLPGPSVTAPFGCKSFSLELTVSKNITLFGIQVPTFFPGMMGTTAKLYEEVYIVSIQNTSKTNKPMLGSINWNGKVAYNTFVDLHFSNSVRLEKNNTYTIMVYTNNTYYLNQKLCTVEEAKGIKFTLKDSVSLFGKQGKQDFAFISQLIYSP